MKKRFIIPFLTMFLVIMGVALVNDQSAAKVKTVKKSVIMTKKEKKTLKATGAKGTVKWKSSKAGVASVKKGKVTAKKKGKAKITAKAKNKSFVFTITVEDPKISARSTSMTVGGSTKLKVNRTKRKVTWSSSNSAVATVSAKGEVIALSPGSAVISGKVGKKNYKCKVTVSAKVIVPSPSPDIPSPSVAPSLEPSKEPSKYVEDQRFVVKRIADNCLYIAEGNAEEINYAIEMNEDIVVSENGEEALITSIAVGDYITPKFLRTELTYPEGNVKACETIVIESKGTGLEPPLTAYVTGIDDGVITVSKTKGGKEYATVNLLKTLYIEKNGEVVDGSVIAIGDKLTIEYFIMSTIGKPYSISGCSSILIEE